LLAAEDIQGLETNGGTDLINKGKPAKHDSFVVRRLRDQGAIIVGHTNMHEIGFGSKL
jgi:Asp-tRNA(Asn)/Glu-tRNA(Gln) amidotransferase A subunit family amidase